MHNRQADLDHDEVLRQMIANNPALAFLAAQSQPMVARERKQQDGSQHGYLWGAILFLCGIIVFQLSRMETKKEADSHLGGSGIAWDNSTSTKSNLDALLTLLSFVVLPISLPALGFVLNVLERRYQQAGGFFAQAPHEQRQPNPEPLRYEL